MEVGVHEAASSSVYGVNESERAFDVMGTPR